MTPDLAARFLRFDARSLGLFRLVFGTALIFDLFHRWDWIRAFYSNDGVLPNHNHLFQLKDDGQVWSVYHSFSSVEECFVAFLITLVIYLFFTLGYHTRVFHAVSLVCLIGLSARNTLAEGPGNSVAIALLFVTLFMPLGARFSLDSLGRSLADFDEHTPEELNDRTRPTPLQAPQSLAALATLLMLGLVTIGAATSQTGATWQDGSALYYALHVDRWTSAIGVAVREQVGILSVWTKLLRYAEIAVVPLALLPVVRKLTRTLAASLLAFVGLTIGLLFTFGLYGWSLLAAAFLLIPEEAWEALKKRRPTTMIYDDDCGICLFGARVLKRLDLRQNITFQANSDEAALPDGITAAMADRSMIAVDPAGKAHMDAAAVCTLLRALPLFGWLGWLLSLPGLFQLMRRLYFEVADNRLDISVAWGMGACGIARPDQVAATADDGAPSPASQTWSALRALVTSTGALVVLLAVWGQSERNDTIPVELGMGSRDALVDIATWSRILAPWGLWAPDPPLANEGMVTVAKTRGEYTVDVLTGYPPDEELENPRLSRRGHLWATYTASIADDINTPYHKEFRRYLTKGGYALDTRAPDNYIRQLAVYWVSVPTPPPGSPPGERPKATKDEIFTRSSRVNGPQRPKLPFPRATPEE